MSKKIFLASKSPRRQELLKLMNISFELLVKEVDEDFPSDLSLIDVAGYIAQKKASAFKIEDSEAIIITADTVVILENEILGKPKNAEQAEEMLTKLSDKTHLVVTGVVLKSIKKTISFSCTTKVTFKEISKSNIKYYVDNYSPFDKAGAYGIQDWIGAVAVQSIEGSYTNVMGLPTQTLFEKLKEM